VTDLVGSTALRVRLGDRAADEVRRRHERLVRRSAAHFDATIVHWLGDGVLAAFPSASAAAQAAIAVQRANERSNRRPDRLAELSIRCGVAAGETKRVGDDLGGAPVDDAMALCNEARGGEILCRPDLLELIGSRLRLEVAERSADTHVVLWPAPRSVGATLGLPHALEADRPLPFVGRDQARHELRQGFEAVLTGRPRLVSIRGEAGIGKTRLVAEFARGALAEGAAILFGACRAELGLANSPVAHAFRGWMEAAEDVSARLGTGAGELVRLVPELAARAPGLDPPTESDAETERLRLYDAVGEWLVDASLDEPIVLILDSMHWGSPATFDLIEHVLPMLERARVLVLTTHRPEARADTLIRCARDALGPASGVAIELRGLDLPEVGDLLTQVHHADAQRHDARLLYTVTRGNPLHLNEILRLPGAGGSLPDTIQAAVRLHLDRLEGGQRQAVEAAAVLGAEFEARCLAEMTGQMDLTLDALDAAADAGLLLDVEGAALRYRFAHDVTRQTAMDAIGAGRLTRLHEKAGLAIERVGGGDHALEDLARHFAAAAALGHQEKAAEYCARAAEQAARQYANESAESWYRQALELVGSARRDGRWCDLAVGRGEALRRLGDPEHRPWLLAVADRAHELGDGERMAKALITTYRGTFSRAMDVDEGYVERLRRAARLVGDEPTTTRARLLALIGVETAWAPDQQESRRTMDEAVAVARSLGDPNLLASVLAHRQWVVFHPLAERLAETEELARLAERCPDPLLRFDALGSEAFTRTRAGDRVGLDLAMERLRASAAAVDQPLVRWMLMFRESTLALMEARFGDAQRCIEEGRKLARATGQPDAEPQYVVQRFWLDLETQALEPARAQTRVLVQNFRKMPPLKAWASIAFRAAELGLLEETRQVLDGMAEIGFESIPHDQAWLVTMCALAAAAAAVRDEEAARRIHALLEPHAAEHANVIFVSIGSVERYLGLLCGSLGRLHDAEQHFRRAIAANRAMDAAAWVVRSQLDSVEPERERPALDEARRELLAEATASAARLGLPVQLERAERLASGR
jgi:hypothetical protein